MRFSSLSYTRPVSLLLSPSYVDFLRKTYVERSAKKHKVLRTTVIVIGAVALCFVSVVSVLVLRALEIATSELVSWFVTFVMLNLLLNSLILM